MSRDSGRMWPERFSSGLDSSLSGIKSYKRPSEMPSSSAHADPSVARPSLLSSKGGGRFAQIASSQLRLDQLGPSHWRTPAPYTGEGDGETDKERERQNRIPDVSDTRNLHMKSVQMLDRIGDASLIPKLIATFNDQGSRRSAYARTISGLPMPVKKDENFVPFVTVNENTAEADEKEPYLHPQPSRLPLPPSPSSASPLPPELHLPVETSPSNSPAPAAAVPDSLKASIQHVGLCLQCLEKDLQQVTTQLRRDHNIHREAPEGLSPPVSPSNQGTILKKEKGPLDLPSPSASLATVRRAQTLSPTHSQTPPLSVSMRLLMDPQEDPEKVSAVSPSLSPAPPRRLLLHAATAPNPAGLSDKGSLSPSASSAGAKERERKGEHLHLSSPLEGENEFGPSPSPAETSQSHRRQRERGGGQEDLNLKEPLKLVRSLAERLTDFRRVFSTFATDVETALEERAARERRANPEPLRQQRRLQELERTSAEALVALEAEKLRLHERLRQLSDAVNDQWKKERQRVEAVAIRLRDRLRDLDVCDPGNPMEALLDELQSHKGKLAEAEQICERHAKFVAEAENRLESIGRRLKGQQAEAQLLSVQHEARKDELVRVSQTAETLLENALMAQEEIHAYRLQAMEQKYCRDAIENTTRKLLATLPKPSESWESSEDAEESFHLPPTQANSVTQSMSLQTRQAGAGGETGKPKNSLWSKLSKALTEDQTRELENNVPENIPSASVSPLLPPSASPTLGPAVAVGTSLPQSLSGRSVIWHGDRESSPNPQAPSLTGEGSAVLERNESQGVPGGLSVSGAGGEPSGLLPPDDSLIERSVVSSTVLEPPETGEGNHSGLVEPPLCLSATSASQRYEVIVKKSEGWAELDESKLLVVANRVEEQLQRAEAGGGEAGEAGGESGGQKEESGEAKGGEGGKSQGQGEGEGGQKEGGGEGGGEDDQSAGGAAAAAARKKGRHIAIRAVQALNRLSKPIRTQTVNQSSRKIGSSAVARLVVIEEDFKSFRNMMAGVRQEPEADLMVNLIPPIGAEDASQRAISGLANLPGALDMGLSLSPSASAVGASIGGSSRSSGPAQHQSEALYVDQIFLNLTPFEPPKAGVRRKGGRGSNASQESSTQGTGIDDETSNALIRGEIGDRSPCGFSQRMGAYLKAALVRQSEEERMDGGGTTRRNDGMSSPTKSPLGTMRGPGTSKSPLSKLQAAAASVLNSKFPSATDIAMSSIGEILSLNETIATSRLLLDAYTHDVLLMGLQEGQLAGLAPFPEFAHAWLERFQVVIPPTGSSEETNEEEEDEAHQEETSPVSALDEESPASMRGHAVSSSQAAAASIKAKKDPGEAKTWLQERGGQRGALRHLDSFVEAAAVEDAAELMKQMDGTAMGGGGGTSFLKKKKASRKWEGTLREAMPFGAFLLAVLSHRARGGVELHTVASFLLEEWPSDVMLFYCQARWEVMGGAEVQKAENLTDWRTLDWLAKMSENDNGACLAMHPPLCLRQEHRLFSSRKPEWRREKAARERQERKNGPPPPGTMALNIGEGRELVSSQLILRFLTDEYRVERQRRLYAFKCLCVLALSFDPQSQDMSRSSRGSDISIVARGAASLQGLSIEQVSVIVGAIFPLPPECPLSEDLLALSVYRKALRLGSGKVDFAPLALAAEECGLWGLCLKHPLDSQMGLATTGPFGADNVEPLTAMTESAFERLKFAVDDHRPLLLRTASLAVIPRLLAETDDEAMVHSRSPFRVMGMLMALFRVTFLWSFSQVTSLPQMAVGQTEWSSVQVRHLQEAFDALLGTVQMHFDSLQRGRWPVHGFSPKPSGGE
uniref:Uncharacterized protein n=1 Tax=Chromera velia CCMP2878 TaxID=1169474 RepID=A0A0G4HBR7_9ALVE|eukprot:Cvel_6177.t1-p1 / transcript=Cvel_6177.t1 / gene=Cvel_6177 / organism=Chromera_velia_CCMP2878 / gene_product=hypothetical protein / transcript_product=hypothetical protein / location=Cvel_scaffold299:24393-33582(-) / protein_length=1819 / sequence_SO=supercontig / SO=protein_coding / is_pseudo=false